MIVFAVSSILYHQHWCKFAYALPNAYYSSVRHQLPEKQKVFVVGSDLPLAILSNPTIATQPSMQGSIFARPYENMKHSPQYDVNLIGFHSTANIKSSKNIEPIKAATTTTTINDDSIEGEQKIRWPRSIIPNFIDAKRVHNKLISQLNSLKFDSNNYSNDNDGHYNSDIISDLPQTFNTKSFDRTSNNQLHKEKRFRRGLVFNEPSIEIEIDGGNNKIAIYAFTDSPPTQPYPQQWLLQPPNRVSAHVQ